LLFCAVYKYSILNYSRHALLTRYMLWPCTCQTVRYKPVLYWLVAWHGGRMSVFDRRTFPVLRSTCSWWVTTYLGKPSAIGQPTRPTQPFIISRSIN